MCVVVGARGVWVVSVAGCVGVDVACVCVCVQGINGWRTAHNPPNPALLYAADTLGLVVWDETHRNGILSELELLIRRDRNHPRCCGRRVCKTDVFDCRRKVCLLRSVVIWSLCNEVLCETSNWTADALAGKALIRELDPLGGRPVSANQNGWIGPNTPLDVQGFDYTTQNYDEWHSQAPDIPSISSETCSSMSDRDTYANNATTGVVSAYDTNAAGERPESGWGGKVAVVLVRRPVDEHVCVAN